MKIIQFNSDVGRHGQVTIPKSSVDKIRNALDEPEVEGPLTDYETMPIIEAILANAKLVFSEEVWRDWQMSRQHLHIFEAAEKIIEEAGKHIPMWDWIEPENTAWQMDRLRIYPHGIDIYNEDPLDYLREPERLFAHIHMEKVGDADSYLTKPEKLATVYPDLDLDVLKLDDLWERISCLGLTGGRQYLHICTQIGMLRTGNMLLDYSETELIDNGYDHPEWEEYPIWIAEAQRASELQGCSNQVLDWVQKNQDKHLNLVIEAVNQAVHVTIDSLYASRARWAQQGFRSQRW